MKKRLYLLIGGLICGVFLLTLSCASGGGGVDSTAKSEKFIESELVAVADEDMVYESADGFGVSSASMMEASRDSAGDPMGKRVDSSSIIIGDIEVESTMYPEIYPPTVQPGARILTAGEWSDLDNWEFWNALQESNNYGEMGNYWGYNRVLGERYTVELQQADGTPIIGEPVILFLQEKGLWRGVTDNKGVVELWAPRLMYRDLYNSRTLELRVRGEMYAGLVPYESGINRIVLEQGAVEPGSVEIAWVVDATGSMGDELNYLKVELQDVIAKVQNQNPQSSITMGSVFYRDQGDEYVTRTSPFSRNIMDTIDFIGYQYAAGGGDYPEAVHTALWEALQGLQWSENSSSKLLFLLLDAPPHYDQQVVEDMHNIVSLAASKGVQIIPIVASGIDKETEFLMRYMSIATNGTYTFITNHSGVGGDHIEPTIGEYKVEFLNDLLIRLINESLQ